MSSQYYKERMRLGYIVVFGLVLISIITLGCVDNKDSNDDQKLTSLMSTSIKVITVDAEEISNADSNIDFENMAISGRYLKEDSQMYLDELNKLNISPSYMPMADEYKKALENFYLMGKYIELGAKNVDVESLELSESYKYKGLYHLKRAVAMAPTS